MLLVQVVQDDRVGIDAVQQLAALQPGNVAQGDGKQSHLTEPLYLLPVLMEQRLAPPGPLLVPRRLEGIDLRRLSHALAFLGSFPTVYSLGPTPRRRKRQTG